MFTSLLRKETKQVIVRRGLSENAVDYLPRGILIQNLHLSFQKSKVSWSLFVNVLPISDNIMTYSMSKSLCSWKARCRRPIVLSFDHQVRFHVLGLLGLGLNHSLTAQGRYLPCFTQERGYNYALVARILFAAEHIYKVLRVSVPLFVGR